MLLYSFFLYIYFLYSETSHTVYFPRWSLAVLIPSGYITRARGDITGISGPSEDEPHLYHTCLAWLTRGRGVHAASPPASQCTSAGARDGRCVAPLPHLNLTLFIASLASTWTSSYRRAGQPQYRTRPRLPLADAATGSCCLYVQSKPRKAVAPSAFEVSIGGEW